MKINDRRTGKQRETHTWLVVGTDPFLSGWGECKNGSSYAAWACKPTDRMACLSWVEGRGDMKRVREVYDPPNDPYRPNSAHCGHLSIYVWNKEERDQ